MRLSRLTGEIKYLTRCMNRYKSERLQPLGINVRQAELLLGVRRLQEPSQDDLADALMMNKSSVARHLAVLEEKALIRRTPDAKDRRVLRVGLTEVGEALLPAIRAINTAWSDYIAQGLSEQELKQAEALLDVVLKRAQAYWKEGEQT
ncbi:MAG: MarR family transcriptional regulator [Oscillospiraceae bacterium]|nr:MarR family transcriptional regulator [Oscillospiraceae bacterium]